MRVLFERNWGVKGRSNSPLRCPPAKHSSLPKGGENSSPFTSSVSISHGNSWLESVQQYDNRQEWNFKTPILTEEPNGVKDGILPYDLHTTHVKVNFRVSPPLFSLPFQKAWMEKNYLKLLGISRSINGRPDVACLLSKEKVNSLF